MLLVLKIQTEAEPIYLSVAPRRTTYMKLLKYGDLCVVPGEYFAGVI